VETSDLKLNGALLINKPEGMSSFGVIEELKKSLRESKGLKRKEMPKLGHGGTLDPFATGLLVVLVGSASKLARYFLNSEKGYEGVFRFGETTLPGDPTDEISEKTQALPDSKESLQLLASQLCMEPYLQTPPMHSSKKHQGKPLYKLARQGKTVEREPKACTLKNFEILSYESPRAPFQVHCSSGTYIRTLAQDLGKMAGSLGMLDSLNRTHCDHFKLENALDLKSVCAAEDWSTLSCWVPFDELLQKYPKTLASTGEVHALRQGRQNVLLGLVRRSNPAPTPSHPTWPLGIYHENQLVAVASRAERGWELDRVF